MKAEARPIVSNFGSLAVAAQAAIAGLLVLFAYRDVLPPLVTEWYEHENFSYGFLIPFIFIYLVWDRRVRFSELKTAWAPWGIATLGLALFLGIVGQTAGEAFLSRVSLVLAVASLVHLFWGWPLVRCLAFPLGYLFLMVPPPYPIVKAVSFYLKMFDAWVAAILLPLAGVPIYRDAYLLHLPNITLEVADICSGIASLFAMGALGLLYAYHLPVKPVGKVAVLFGALVLPVVANLFRIFLIGVSVYYYGPVMLGAFFHTFTGTFTFLLSLAMLFGWGEWVRRLKTFSVADIGDRPLEGTSTMVNGIGGAHQTSWLSVPFGAALIVLAAMLLLSAWTRDSASEGSLPELQHLAARLGNYETAADQPDEAYRDPYAEAAISRLYHSGEEQIELFVGYRRRQFGTERLRSPKLVFPEGWEYVSVGKLEIPLAAGQTIDGIWVETRKGPARKLVVFWYRMRGRSFASDLGNRLEVLRGLLLHGRTDGAVVRLARRVEEGESMVQAKQRLSSFAALLHPQLVRVLPD